MLNQILKKFKLSAEWAELIWKIVTFIFVLLGTTSTALLARASKEINELGSFIWVLVTIASALVFSLMVYLVNLSKKKNAEATKLSIEANYLSTLSTPKSTINPLSDVFTDQIIYLPDLYLPRMQMHKNKVFKRCQIVGPGCIAILGGSLIRTNFFENGSILLLPNRSTVVGAIAFETCIFEDCEIMNTTILINYEIRQAFVDFGAHVPDIKDYFPKEVIDRNSSINSK
ncbi:hypothetical protein [Acinetobacter nosocomialis]|uniref:hypothetical protein n=1 Tax=Acinetobacter nosocomialis TaxID=106654 RepID=UPI001B834F2C|nr:hypothetical protein [Acinetobacter nosocomialis]MBR7679953.1 hypothetical protein [Acinetobacter nosocomialis]